VGDLLGAIDEHEVKPLMHHPAGQSIAYFNEVRSVADVMRGIVDEACDGLERLGVTGADVTLNPPRTNN
jgi:hypothetical protein